MFGPHKGENVCTIEEAGKIARDRLNEAARQGKIYLIKKQLFMRNRIIEG